MTKLQELNTQLYLHNVAGIEIAKQIDIETKLHQAILLEPYKSLVGKCFKYVEGTDYCYRILQMSQINSHDTITAVTLICQSNEIYKHNKIHMAKDVTEITLEQFESNLLQTCNNMLQIDDKNYSQLRR